MMKTVHQVSEISGVSVRTLHHYDAIGLLTPSAVTDAGYRLYDDDAIGRLQSILLLRELDFPLRRIAEILDNPRFDRNEALRMQIKMLESQKKQADRMIALARKIIQTGVYDMDFSAFDKSETERYAAEAKERWGDTGAWREYEGKAKKRKGGENNMLEGLMAIFADAGKIRESAPDSTEAKALVSRLRTYITENMYDCTKPILSSLGEMYASDGRFRDNIDARGGDGTALFVSRAIASYCADAEG